MVQKPVEAKFHPRYKLQWMYKRSHSLRCLKPRSLRMRNKQEDAEIAKNRQWQITEKINSDMHSCLLLFSTQINHQRKSLEATVTL